MREYEGVLTADLPDALREALRRELPFGSGRAAAGALSERYRSSPAGTGRRAGRHEVAAYAATRLPATYAATAVVLAELRARAPTFAPRSQLDLGAGLGAALWAAAATWPTSLARARAVELEPAMLDLGRGLARSGPAVVAACSWEHGDAGVAVGSFDLVTLGYVLNELEPATLARFVEAAWGAASGVLAVVEPGTPDGYRRVLAVREQVAALGGFTVAPCPHERPCPLGKGDWCHFAVRLPRSAAHRVAKGAQAGFEDEKFAYVVMARQERARAEARVLRHPQVRGGHVRLELCTARGLARAVVAKSDREAFREARKASWGDAFGAVALQCETHQGG